MSQGAGRCRCIPELISPMGLVAECRGHAWGGRRGGLGGLVGVAAGGCGECGYLGWLCAAGGARLCLRPGVSGVGGDLAARVGAFR